MVKGLVYLAGAGPGDAKLLTLRVAELLVKVDIVLYDKLVGKRYCPMIKLINSIASSAGRVIAIVLPCTCIRLSPSDAVCKIYHVAYYDDCRRFYFLALYL